jgi:hypothetical protein
MRLERLAKDAGSGYGGCPSAYLDLDDPQWSVVQADGNVPMSALLNVLPGEKGVRIKTQVLLDFADSLRSRG